MPVTNPVPKAIAKAAVDAFEKRRQEHRQAALIREGKIKKIATALAFAIGTILGVALDKVHAQTMPISEQKQYAMVLIASDIMAQAQCGAAEKPITKIRYNMLTKADQAAFLVTVDAIAKIYLADPAAFCRRAALNAGK